jgi:hypothetical protein
MTPEEYEQEIRAAEIRKAVAREGYEHAVEYLARMKAAYWYAQEQAKKQ